MSRLALGYLLVALAGAGFAWTPLAERLELGLLDWQLRSLRGFARPAAEPEVVVVGIDEDTHRAFREPFALWQPHWGRLLDALAAARPAVVGLDVVLPDRSYEALFPGYDRPLLRGLRALAERAPLVLGQTVELDGRWRAISPFVLAAAGNRVGSVVVDLDRDGVLRRYPASWQTGEGEQASLAARMAKALGHEPAAGLIDFTIGAPFDYVPMHEVIAWRADEQRARLRDRLGGKAVLVGLVLPFEDVHRLPVPMAAWQPRHGRVPGVLAHAQALRSFLTRGTIRPLAPAFELALIALLAALWWAAGRPVRGIVLLVVVGAATIAAASTLLWAGSHLPVAAALVTALLAVAARAASLAWAALRERRRLRQSFGAYVSPAVMQEILAGRIASSTGGQRRPICVLFSDVRNFTTLSESRPPEAVIALLNRYFTDMVEAVHEQQGTVDKFIGDGLMCFFGAPQTLDDPCHAAFRSACSMVERLERINDTLDTEHGLRLDIGVGLHFGPAVVGHVGSVSRHEYTAIGDTVNIAARLEGLTKTLGVNIALSEPVADALAGRVPLLELGEQAIKGRAPVKVYGWRKDLA